MTTYSAILSAPQVAPNQNQKEATINTATAIIEGACNDHETIDLSGGNHTLTTDEFTKYFHQVYSGHSVARTVTLPNTVRFFAASNLGTAAITVQCAGTPGTTVAIPAGARGLLVSDGTNVVLVTSGVSHLADLTDTAGVGSASNAQYLAFDNTSGKWIPVSPSADQAFGIAGAPTASQKVHLRSIARSVRFVGDFLGSVAHAGTAATASTVFNVYKNGTLVGTITFAAAATTGTFSTDVGSGSTSVTFNIGDVLMVQAPASPDATLADISITLLGVLI